ncbi:MAG: ParA family protein, partial [Pirellulaceae bacterium]
LTLHLYEEKIASRWTDVYRGDPLAIRTITRLRAIAKRYTQEKGYDFVIIDTSPSLGGLNKVIISTVDGFFIPAAPDLFSLYGIRNIGRSLKSWKEEFEIIYQLISKEKRHNFPKEFVKFLG